VEPQVPTADEEKLEQLAREIADQITTGQGSVVRWTSSVDDIEAWRKAARRAGRILGVSIRTGVSDDRTRVWAIDAS
jgi:hypothetical protein